MEEVKPVNLPFSPPDLVGNYKSGYSPSEYQGQVDYHDIFNGLLSQGSSNSTKDFPVVEGKELPQGERYPIFYPGRPNEEMYAQGQSAGRQLWNGVVKMGATSVGTFAQSFATIPNVIEALSKWDVQYLSGEPNGWEADIDNWLKNMEDRFPNYMTQREKDHPYLAMIPGFAGSANFWGNSFIKNLGFTVGAIGGAAVQGLATGGVLNVLGKALPVAVAANIGKGALWLNKIFTGTDGVEKLSALASDAAVPLEQAASMEKLAQLAAATKIKNGVNYGLTLFGATRTEGGVEARDGYIQIRESLIQDYKDTHGGISPSEEELLEIDKYAKDGQNVRFGINMAILTISDAIMWGNMLKSFSRSGKGVFGPEVTKTLQGIGKVGLKEKSLDVFEPKMPSTIAGKVWDKIRPSLPTMFSEGVYEEGGQYAAERGTLDYYTRKYKNFNNPYNKERWDDLKEITDSTLKGFADQFGTYEGMQNMMVGALTAIFMGAITGKVDAIAGDGKDARLQKVINTLNKYGITGVLSDKVNSTLSASEIASQMEDAVKNKDIFKFKNLKSNLFAEYVLSRLPQGLHEVTIEQLNMLKDLNNEQFTDIFGTEFNSTNKQTVNQYVDLLIARANEIKNTYDNINNTFKNPFRSFLNPTTDEERTEDKNHTTFNEWKKNIVLYSNDISELNSRMSEMGMSLSKIHPLISTETISKLTNFDSLKDLADVYREEAANVEKNIELSSPEMKREYKNKSKALRNYAERIDLNVRKNTPLDNKLFNDLLNFEINNRDITKEQQISPEQSINAYGLGVDVNRAISLKKRVRDILDDLISESGTNRFFKQADEINIPKEEEKKEAPPSGFVIPSYENSKKERENIEIGRSYKILKQEKASVKKIVAEGGKSNYQVVAPDGIILSTYEKRADAIGAANEFNSDLGDFQKVKVVDVLDENTIVIEDKNGNLQRISPEELKGYQRVISPEERLAKDKETIDKQQEEIENNSTPVSPTNPLEGSTIEESKIPDASIMFISGTSESEDGEKILAPHTIISETFLNNAYSFPNRNNLRAIMVPHKFEEQFGLKGLANISYGGATQYDVNDNDHSLIMQVFVEEEKGKYYFVDVEGKRMGEVGKQVEDLSKIVFQTMRTTELTYARDNSPRYRANQREEAEIQSKLWSEKRKQLLSSPQIKGYQFNISRGIAIMEKNPSTGMYETNHVGGVLIPEEDISTTNGIVEVSTVGSIFFKGQNIKTTQGLTVFKNGDTLVFLNRNFLGKKRAASVYQVIKQLSEEVLEKHKLGALKDYLATILHWTNKKGDNNFYIDVEKGEIRVGNRNYKLSDVDELENEITEQLSGMYHDVNNKALKNTGDFTEYTYDGEKLIETKWDNYQTYLLSSKGRTVSETPLVTNVSKPTDDHPYSFKQRYATLIDVEMPARDVIKEEKKQEAPATEQKKVDKYIIDGSTENVYSFPNIGDVKFTASLENGKIYATVNSDQEILNKFANTPKSVALFKEALIKENIAPGNTNEEIVSTFFANAISANLNALQEKETVAPQYQEESLESKKADIERRRQEELDKINQRIEKLKQREDRRVKIETYRTLDINDNPVEVEITINADGSRLLRARLINEDGSVEPMAHVVERINNKAQAIFSNEQLVENYIGNEGNTLKRTNLDENPDQTYINKINAKYDAELAALENTSKSPTIEEDEGPEESEFRLVNNEESKERITESDLIYFQEWAKENVKGIPYEILENMVKAYPNREAWGVFEEGVAKFYRYAIRGTEYHEIFEGIWKAFLLPAEKDAILTEFRNRRGFFKDRITGEDIHFANATDKQAKERLADEFADFRLGKLPARTLGERILKFFRQIVEFFKSFVRKPSLKEELFNSIDKGKYKEYTIPKAEIKQGVDAVFEQNPELSSIGTAKQYSQYLDTIFPDSKVKDIVYHGTDKKFEVFDKLLSGLKTGWGSRFKGIHFFNNNDAATTYKRSRGDYEGFLPLYLYVKQYAKNGKSLTKEEFDNIISDKNTLVKVLEGAHYYGAIDIDSITYKEYKNWADIFDKDSDLNDFNDDNLDELTIDIANKYVNKEGNIIKAILDIKNPLIYNAKEKRYVQVIEKIYDNLDKSNDGILVENTLDRLNDDIGFQDNIQVVFEPEQIHILGSKQDIEGFKQWKENNGPEYRLKDVSNISETHVYQYVQDMTVRTVQFIFGDDKKNLFDIQKTTGREVYNYIKEQYSSDREKKYQRIEAAGEGNFNKLWDRTKQLLRTLGIKFNDEDFIDINDEGINNRDYSPEAFSTDWKKFSPYAVKLILYTLPKTKHQRKALLKLPEIITSGVKGYVPLQFSQAFATLMTKLSNTTELDEYEKKIVDLMKHDGDYVRLFNRLGGKTNEEGDQFFDYTNFGKADWRLFINFYQTFTKQHPEAVVQYTNGLEVYTGSAELFSPAQQLRDEWFQQMRILSASDTPIIKWNKKSKTYVVEKYSTAIPKTAEDALNFLEKIGVNIGMNIYGRLKTSPQGIEEKSQQQEFFEAVASIHTYLQKNKEISKINGDVMGIAGPLRKLSELVVKVSNPNRENIHYNVEDQPQQSNEENNYSSYFENEFNSCKTLDELLEKRPQLRDVFSTNSQILKKGGLFFNKAGKRIRDIKVMVIGGNKDTNADVGKKIAGLTRGERDVTQINQNINGVYYILIPADSATEWAMKLGNTVSYKSDKWQKIYDIFLGYLKDDVALALDYEKRGQLRNVGKKAKELRFFKDILSDNVIENMIEKGNTQQEIETYINDNIEKINKDIKAYIDEYNENTKKDLIDNGAVIKIGEEYAFLGLDSDFVKENELKKDKITGEELNDILLFVNSNYIINNIEFHKILFGDPLQFKTEKANIEEIKRIKSFLSPRRTMFDNVYFNNFLNKEYNKAGDIELSPKDVGYHNHRSFTRTATIQDIIFPTRNYDKVNEADGASIIMDTTFREVKVKNGQWPEEADVWHDWQMAYTRNRLNKKGLYGYSSTKLKEYDEALLKQKEPRYTIDVIKPIVSGVKADDSNTINLVLDKFSQMPLYYKAAEERGLEDLYIKMWKEDIGYVIFESGRKVGITETNNIYKEGKVTDVPFTGIINVPWSAYGLQLETSYNKPKQQTYGSQTGKVSTIDLFENGVPLTEKIGNAYKKLVSSHNALHRNGYNTILSKLGVEDMGDYFKVNDPSALQETLQSEMMRRELSQNAIDVIQLDENKQFPIPFEASTHYKQIKDIIYSIVNNNLLRPKYSGKSCVQVPVTLWENKKEGRGLVIKRTAEDGKLSYEKISQEQYNSLTEDERKDVHLSSDTLHFYTDGDGQRWCGVMLPHWFKEQLSKKKFPNDKAILDYLNNTEEGRRILSGIGFRIPTQAMSSIELFHVEGFLPQFMGDTIVVPSEITAKAGSDFDIDKLNAYLKSIYVDERGDIRLVALHGTDEETKAFYKNVYDKTKGRENSIILSILNKLEARPTEERGLSREEYTLSDEESEFYDDEIEKINEIIDTADALKMDASEYMKQRIENDIERETFANDKYQRALENEYYEALEEMMGVPENFKALLRPVDDGGLKDVAKELDKLKGYDESDIKNKILNRSYLSNMRHSFMLSKKWIGIVAVSITGHSLFQKGKVYLNDKRIPLLEKWERELIGDGKILLPHNTIEIDGIEYPSLSGRMVAKGGMAIGKALQYISERLSGYATGMVDVVKNPYIMKIISSDILVDTFLFLERLGAGETGVMFLNQPIITEYMKMMDREGARNITNKANIQRAIGMFSSEFVPKEDYQLDLTYDTLTDNIEKYHKGKLTEEEKYQQQVILYEFLKYNRMGKHVFKLTQATNYDTQRIRSGAAFRNREFKRETAEEGNLFSGVDEIMSNTFLGKLAEAEDDAMKAIGELLKTEQKDIVGNILSPLMRPYDEQSILSKDDYDRIDNKLKSSFIDYVVQTKGGINNNIYELLVNPETSVTTRLLSVLQKHPEMKILQDIIPVFHGEDMENNTKTVKLKVNNRGDAFSEDVYTSMMRELKEIEPELYNDIVLTGVLQGTYQSAISFKNIIPTEDYARALSKAIESLDASNPTLQDYRKENWFQRNNFRDEKIVPKYKWVGFWQPEWMQPIEDPMGEEVNTYFLSRFKLPYNPEELALKTSERKLMFLSPDSSFGAYDVLSIPRILNNGAEMVDFVTGKTITPYYYAVRKGKNDPTLYQMFGYKKVKYEDGTPILSINGDYIYKRINLYGDGQYASEYYTDTHPSVLNNGTAKIEIEMSDNDIIKYFAKKEQKRVENVVSLQEKPNMNPQFEGKTEFNKLPTKSTIPTMTYAGIGSRQTPPEILKQMTEVAKELESKGYTLNTGKTFNNKEEGADKAFSDGATKKNLFSPEKQGSRTREQIIAKEIHPAPQYLQAGGLKLMARNTNQVFGDDLNTPVDFVLFYAKETKGIRPEGGTGQAVEMARMKGIPTINMSDKNWREQLNGVLSQKETFNSIPEFNEERIRISHPKIIKVKGVSFPTDKLKEIRDVFNFNAISDKMDKETVEDRRDFKTKEGRKYLKDYGMSDEQYKYTLNNESVISKFIEINDNLKYGEELIDETINKLLKENEIITDLNQMVIYNEFEELQEFTSERKKEIITNFAVKHKMTEEQALNYINEALLKERENVIDKLKECY